MIHVRAVHAKRPARCANTVTGLGTHSRYHERGTLMDTINDKPVPQAQSDAVLQARAARWLEIYQQEAAKWGLSPTAPAGGSR